jgi:hypothetical protein
MLTRDARLEGFTASDWVRLADVVHPRRRQRRAGVPRGGVVAVVQGSRLRKLVSTRRGRLELADHPWPMSLEQLAANHEAHWAVELSSGALEEVMDRFAERLRPDQDLLAQSLVLLGVFRELEAKGSLRFWPWRFGQFPLPSERVVLRALDAVCPDGKSIVIGMFDAGALATCFAARRRGSGFDHIIGPDLLRPEMGLVSGDWTRDYRHLARAVEERLGPLAVGLFAEQRTWQRLADQPTPGAWAAAVAARDVILSPVAPALAVPLGVDVGRAAIATVQKLAERVGAAGLFGSESPFGPALERVQRFAAEDLERMLGFDPLATLRSLLGAPSNRRPDS